jgi:hypothetical protein
VMAACASLLRATSDASAWKAPNAQKHVSTKASATKGDFVVLIIIILPLVSVVKTD